VSDIPVVTMPDRAKADALRAEVTPLLETAKALVVVDQQTHDEALKLGGQFATYSKMRDGLYREGASMADKLHKWFTKQIGEVCNPLKIAKDDLDRRAMSWERAEREKLRVAEQKRQEEERKRIEEERLQQAMNLEQRGRPELAEAVLEKKIEVAPIKENLQVQRPQGTVAVEDWDGEVIDPFILPREYLMPDLVKLRKVTKAMKGATRIAGWHAFPVDRVRRTG
jgi:hypothetical protein